MTLPLDGIRVLDLGRMVAAPIAAQNLGDLGADVIKVERPGIGDDMRTFGPNYLKRLDGGQGDSAYHLSVNRNKRSITVDLASDEGCDLIRQLAEVSDVFIENYKVGDLARRGLDYATISKINPNIIYCSLTGFGQTGPAAHRPGLDSLFQAMTGLMSVNGDPDGPPQKLGLPISDLITGLYSTIAILGALRQREANNGGGQHIDMALLDCQMAGLINWGQAYVTAGVVPHRIGSRMPAQQPGDLYPCADGDIVLTVSSEPQFQAFSDVMGRPDLVTDPRFKDRESRVANRLELEAIIRPIFAQRSRDQWLSAFHSSGVMCAPVNTIAEAFADPQVRHRGTIVDAPHPTAGVVQLIRSPLKYSKSPLPTPRHPPLLGEHTDEVLGDLLGMSHEAISQLRARGAV